MNPLYVSGKIVEITEAEQISEKFRKASLIIETYESHPQRVAFQAINDKVDILADLEENQNVNVFFNIRSNEWNGKIYTNLNLWKVEDPALILTGQKSKSEGSKAPRKAPAPQKEKPAPKKTAQIDEDFLSAEDSFLVDDTDDIPFWFKWSTNKPLIGPIKNPKKASVLQPG